MGPISDIILLDMGRDTIEVTTHIWPNSSWDEMICVPHLHSLGRVARRDFEGWAHLYVGVE